ncbi:MULTISPECIES: hypothetical protein [unclassified Bradyrhizobium]|uniref:hypothetical protein n=1 Tax=unclassified Bradyrhizobium TaxID=2631580 RepID=UPI0028EA3336|nr:MULTISPECIES: hypothetical protein [unclassified Bradyrhizobium]
MENRSRAQRYGADCILVAEDGPVTGQEMLVRLVERIMPRRRGRPAVWTSSRAARSSCSPADSQIRAYRNARDDLAPVTRWIEAATPSQLQRPSVLAETVG